MRTALLAKSRLRLQVSKLAPFPAPTGGLNKRDSYVDMAKNEAVYMVNVYPRGSYVEVRGGNSTYATGMTGNGKTLASYMTMTGAETLYCATPSNIYDVTNSGAVGAAKLARTDGKHQWVNYGDGTNNWLIMVNGVDKPAYFDGTTWTAVDGATTPAITAVTTTDLIGVTVYQGRLYFIQKNTLKTWYLPAGVVGGVAASFDLSTQASRGGYLMAAMGWTFDGGLGPDDHIVFITSMGEAIVYRGTDPATAANWVKVGTFYIGRPIGRQCMCKYGGDLLILTEDGVTAMSGVLTGLANESKYRLTDKIKNLYLPYAQQFGTVYGWQMVVYPKENALIVNAGTSEDTSSVQFVMNMQTGAWTQFTNWNAMSFCLYNKDLYYAIGTKTVKAWTGASDAANNTTAITATFLTAYHNFNSPNHKLVKGIRYQATGNTSSYILSYGVSTTFNSSGLNDSTGTQDNFTVAANTSNKAWGKPQTYGGVWNAGYFSVSDSTSGALLQVNSVEFLYEDGTIGT